VGDLLPAPALSQAGPPPADPALSLGVEGALRGALREALKALASFAVAAALVTAALLWTGPALGWPEPGVRLSGRVVAVESAGADESVTYEARVGRRVVRWSGESDRGRWSRGDTRAGWLVDGRVLYGIAPVPPPFDFYALIAVCGAAWYVRRAVAAVVALYDLRRGSGAPRRGYVAMVQNPFGRGDLRSAVLVWWDDPFDKDGLRTYDRILLADTATYPKLREVHQVGVWEAWVDTGRFSWAPPRWIAVRGGVIVPHRRMLVWGRSALADARRAKVREAIPLPRPGTTPDRPTPRAGTGTLKTFSGHVILLAFFATVPLLKMGGVPATFS
jgi:hypothetical protein